MALTRLINFSQYPSQIKLVGLGYKYPGETQTYTNQVNSQDRSSQVKRRQVNNCSPFLTLSIKKVSETWLKPGKRNRNPKLKPQIVFVYQSDEQIAEK